MADTTQPPRSKRVEKRPPRALPPVERLGLPRSPAGDIYHYLLTATWPRFFGMMCLAFLATNSLFAFAYLAVPGSIESASPGSFRDAFFFSVQTMATIGYGKMVPATTYANVLVSIEALMGILGVALVTGLTFAKFGRPTARVLFSKVAVVSRRDGVRSLMFRMANERSTQIVDVNLHAVVTMNDVTEEGERVRRFHTLPLARNRATTFVLSWTAIHPITPDSPIFGMTREDLEARGANIVVTLIGIDETFAQTVHARYDWAANEIVFGHRFDDIITRGDKGVLSVDYTKFHDTVEVAE